MTLYEINRQIEALLTNVDPETGELLIDAEALDKLNVEREEKIENVALYIKNLTAEAAAIKAEIDNLTKRKNAAERSVARLKDYLSGQLAGEKFTTPKVAVSFRKSSSLDLTDDFMAWATFTGDYLRYKDPEPDKKAITEALKAGTEIPGAVLTEKNNITIK